LQSQSATLYRFQVGWLAGVGEELCVSRRKDMGFHLGGKALLLCWQFSALGLVVFCQRSCSHCSSAF